MQAQHTRPNKLFVYRSATGMTQEDFGLKVGRRYAELRPSIEKNTISGARISEIERGVGSLPRIELCMAIANVLGKELVDVFNDGDWIRLPKELDGACYHKCSRMVTKDRQSGAEVTLASF